MSASTEDRSHLGVEVPNELKTRVRVEAAKEDKSMSEYLRDVLEEATAE